MRKKNAAVWNEPELPKELLNRLKGPVVFVDLGLETCRSILKSLSPDQLEALEKPGFFFFDETKAQTLEHEIRELDLPAKTVVKADLWDLEPCQSLVWIPRRNEERELKLDLVEQAWHALKPNGEFLVLLPTKDLGQTLPMVRKVFGTTHEFPGKISSFFWASRSGERPRRRHEIHFSNKLVKQGPFSLVGRPGVHCYGTIDEGTRSLCEVIEVHEGDKVLDICCGVGAVGIFASQTAGPLGEIVFADGNARVRSLVEINARANNLPKFSSVSLDGLSHLPDESFDLILAHPPGFGTGSLTERIIEESSRLLSPQGRFYLLTKQPRETAPMVVAGFRSVNALIHRSYTILFHDRAQPEGLLADFEDDDQGQ